MEIEVGKLRITSAIRHNELEKDRAHWVDREGYLLSADVGKNMVFKYDDKVCSAKDIEELTIDKREVIVCLKGAKIIFKRVSEGS